MKNKVISIIVPLFKNEQNLSHFIEVINKSKLQLNFIQLVLVIDGDNSKYDFNLYNHVFAKFYEVNIFRFRSNQGQSFATVFGLSKSTGDILITLDIDSYKIDNFYTELNSIINLNYDIKYIELKEANKKLIRSLGSFFFNFVFNCFTFFKVNNVGSSIRIIKKSFYKTVKQKLASNYNQLDIVLINNANTIYFHQLKSQSNKSSYSLIKLLKSFLNTFFNLSPTNLEYVSVELLTLEDAKN